MRPRQPPKRRRFGDVETDERIVATQTASSTAEAVGSFVNRLLPSGDSTRSFASLSSLLRVLPGVARAPLRESLLLRIPHEKEPVSLQHHLALLSLSDDADDRVGEALLGIIASGDRLSGRCCAQALMVLADSSCRVRLDVDSVLPLLSHPSISVRQRVVRLIRGFELFEVSVIVRILLLMVFDLYPSVRSAAVDTLVAILTREDGSHVEYALLENCYRRALVLAKDRDEFVRIGAISIIRKWAFLLAEKGEVHCQKEIDVIFLQLCSLSRDTHMEVRCKAFEAIENLPRVSEDVIRVSLSKKTLKLDRVPKLLLADAAGAFIHGLGDEFYEVRKYACSSLAMLAILSTRHVIEALNLLTDMLNDDSVVVRLKTLDALSHVLTVCSPKVEEKHIHTLLSMLVDVSAPVRHATRKLLHTLKLPDLRAFVSTFDTLFVNMESFPQDKDDCLTIIFSIGRNHLNFVKSLAKDFLPQIQPSNDGECVLNKPKAEAFLMLIIALILSEEDGDSEIRPLLFGSGNNLVEKLSGCLAVVIRGDSLFQFIIRHKHLAIQGKNMDQDNEVGDANINWSRQKLGNAPSLQNWCGDNQVANVPKDHCLIRRLQPEEITSLVESILVRVGDTWPLIGSRSTSETLRVLRGFSEELEMLASDSDSYDAVLVFAFQYIEALALLAKLFNNWSSRKPPFVGKVTADVLLGKLDASLMRILYTFRGLRREEEFHIMELMLLTCVMRLSTPGGYSHHDVHKLYFFLSRVEELLEGIMPSCFLEVLLQTFTQEKGEGMPCSFRADKLLQAFSLRSIPFFGKFKHIKVEMKVPNNDSESPLPFIPGLPVGITFHIKLFNVLNSDRIWLQMITEGEKQHVFLNLPHLQGSEEVRDCTRNFPLYTTPEVEAFSLKATVVIECPFECIFRGDNGIGPKHELVALCKESEIFLARKILEE